MKLKIKTVLNDDWIRSARLAGRGDEEALKELERREKEELVDLTKEEEYEILSEHIQKITEQMKIEV